MQSTTTLRIRAGVGHQGGVFSISAEGDLTATQVVVELTTPGLVLLLATMPASATKLQIQQVAGTAMLLAGLLGGVGSIDTAWIRQAMAALRRAHEWMLKERGHARTARPHEPEASVGADLAGKYAYFDIDWTTFLASRP